MERRDPPPTEEGWFALHDFRTVDWDAWRGASDAERERAIEEGRAYLSAVESVEDADDGASVTYAIAGHKADLLVVHLRPTMDAVERLERRFERTALAGVTERASSYVSVTEVSGYTSPDLFEEGGVADIEEEGLRNYMETRLHPTIPDADYVCFYPMSKRREPEQNWYDLPFEERADHMAAHGEIGREYAGEVTQVITGSIGFDDWEWGVTLFANDPTNVKSLLYEMRFDPSTSRFAEFGPFFAGRRLAPAELGAFLAGEALGGADAGDVAEAASGSHGVRATLEERGVYAGQPHGQDVHAVVLYSEADAGKLAAAVDGLRGNFEHYDTHVKTAVYESREGDRCAVASIWETGSAAETAGGFLSDLPGVVERDDDGFATMGLFYAVEPDYHGEFLEAFAEVRDLLSGMDGHRETVLLANRDDETDMFIDSRWDAREDATAFFRSEEFRETVDWGREVLADRPRHVFLT